MNKNGSRFYLALFYSFVVIALFKLRIIIRMDGLSPIDLPLYCINDYLLLGLVAYICSRIKYFGMPIYMVFFTLTIINIMALSKIGLPLSIPLLTQIGDLMMLQTSVESPGVYRNFLLLIGSIIGLLLTFINPINQFFRGKFFRSVLTGVFALSVLLLLFPIKEPKLAKSVITSLWYSPPSISTMLSKRRFQKISSDNPYQKRNYPQKLANKKNVVFIIIETLSIKDIESELESIMPFLSQLKQQSLWFDNHYSSWPFSSKALYSLVCGQVNYPSELVEMRDLARFPCNSWINTLSKNDYETQVYYSGNLNYDNMRNFFASVGIKNQFDRNQLNPNHKFKESKLSVDDFSMLEPFKKVLKSQSERPFFSMFITMNSHHPFWNPTLLDKSEYTYREAMNYQDAFIREIFSLLRQEGQLSNTLVIITGDHGMRSQFVKDKFMSESMHKVPLIIVGDHIPSEIVESASNHYQIGSTVLDILSNKNIRNSELFEKSSFMFFHSDVSHYYFIKDKEHYLLDGENLYHDNNWINHESSLCEKSDQCGQGLSNFKNIFRGLHEIYN